MYTFSANEEKPRNIASGCFKKEFEFEGKILFKYIQDFCEDLNMITFVYFDEKCSQAFEYEI